jgi:hypothetical protein
MVSLIVLILRLTPPHRPPDRHAQQWRLFLDKSEGMGLSYPHFHRLFSGILQSPEGCGWFAEIHRILRISSRESMLVTFTGTISLMEARGMAELETAHDNE